MEIEASKKNLLKAQDSRRIIGVTKFLRKLQEYKFNSDLWEKIVLEFSKAGFSINGKEK